MNILFLNSLRKSKWGGGEKWMLMAGRGLADRGHHVTIACLPGSEIANKTAEKQLGMIPFSIPADVAFWKMRELKKHLQQLQTDVLICCQNKDVKIGARAARAMGIKAIFARQGLQNLTDKKKYIRPFTQYIDGIITNTTSIKKIYEDFAWMPDHFVHVIYNGVEQREPEALPIREMFGLKSDSSIIFAAGRIDHQKGFDLLIKVASLATQHQQNWQIVVAGEGKLRAELINEARRQQVDDIIQFVGFSNQVPALIKAADVFVMPSRYEGMPNALLEAMSVGKACVATWVNGAGELVEDGKSGLLVASEDYGAIYDQLARILSDEKLRKSMENEAFLRVKNHFTISKMIDRLEALFENQMNRQ